MSKPRTSTFGFLVSSPKWPACCARGAFPLRRSPHSSPYRPMGGGVSQRPDADAFARGHRCAGSARAGEKFAANGRHNQSPRAVVLPRRSTQRNWRARRKALPRSAKRGVLLPDLLLRQGLRSLGSPHRRVTTAWSRHSGEIAHLRRIRSDCGGRLLTDCGRCTVSLCPC